jgi:anti-sigma factor RsiW
MHTDATLTLCPSDEISAYIDGELTPQRELELDLHFASCRACNLQLNDLKQFLRGLDDTLRLEGDLELPKDFTKVVVANAESSVSGLRRPRERFNAVFICVGLSLFVLFALGAQAETLLDQIAAVGGFFGHLIYSFFIGLAIIVRSVASQSDFGPSAAALLAVLFAGFSLYVSRRVMDARDA